MKENSQDGGKKRTSARFGTRLTVSYRPAREPAGREKKGRVLDLSEAGVRFRAENELAKGAELRIKLMFPGDPLEVRGRVVRVFSSKDAEGSFFETAAAFYGLGEEELDRIDMWFYREKMDGKRTDRFSRVNERRRSDRFDVTKAYAEIGRKRWFCPVQNWERGLIRQISKHGALLLVKSPYSYGEKLSVLLHLAAYDDPIRVAAKVVRIKTKNPNLSLFYKHEVGIEFVRMKKSDVSKLDEEEYLRGVIERADGEFV